jgi:nuclear pore complex protein Nup133
MDDGFRAKLLDAMRWEDGRLRTFVDKAQLDAWYRTARECAEKTVVVSYDRMTAANSAAPAAAAAAAARAPAAQHQVNGNGIASGTRLVLGEADEGKMMMPGGLFAV